MSDNPYLRDKVPARYLGEHEITLAGFGRPYFDADGNMLQDLRVRKGDTLYISRSEGLGDSWWHDPKHEAESLYMGNGRRVKPEHTGLSDEELAATGYEFHHPRPDFELIDVVTQSAVQEPPVDMQKVYEVQ